MPASQDPEIGQHDTSDRVEEHAISAQERREARGAYCIPRHGSDGDYAANIGSSTGVDPAWKLERQIVRARDGVRADIRPDYSENPAKRGGELPCSILP